MVLSFQPGQVDGLMTLSILAYILIGGGGVAIIYVISTRLRLPKV